MSETHHQVRQIRKRVGRNLFDAPPRISVVITAYNQAEHIRETVESALNQKYREHDIIVVNDGSKDSSELERELKFFYDDITYIKQRNAGAGAARNTGITHARGEIIAFLNAGNIWQPTFLASQLIHMERHGLDMVYCDASIFGTASAYRRSFSESNPSRGEVNLTSLLERRCRVLLSGTVARKSAIEAAGMFENEKVADPGFHLWVRMAKLGAKMGYQTARLAKIRLNSEPQSEDPSELLTREKDLFKRIAESVELPETESQIVKRRIDEIEGHLALERGHSLLKSGDYTEAITAFQAANRHQPSLRLTAMTFLTRIAPRTVLRLSEPANHSSPR